uniref:Glycosyl transferase n=1 Tax=Schistosoma curassoni TaxID=6186 RepID=A0A183JLA6_9TREM
MTIYVSINYHFYVDEFHTVKHLNRKNYLLVNHHEIQLIHEA